MQNSQLKKWIYPLLFSLIIGPFLGLYGQSLSGTSGLIRIPTANMYPDKTLAIGVTYIPQGYFKRTFGQHRGKPAPNPGSATF